MTVLGDQTKRDAAVHRADIDGLRALAILSVLLFHLDTPGAGGGFIGVDIFFVVSGFLITGRLTREMEAGRFSFVDYVARRLRRLAPALLATLAVVFAAGLLLLGSGELARLTRSTAAAALFGSNLLFWAEAGYFDVSADSKPLLHTWSLAVEMQFYLLWPAVVALLLSALGRRWMAPGWIALAAIGIAASQLMLAVDAAAAFFLTPFRLGEFAIGAACAALTASLSPRDRTADLLRLGGLALIGLGLVSIGRASAFPGVAALIPCLGAALVLLARDRGASSPLSDNALVRWSGQLAYSVYLAHWPIIVFWRSGSFAPLAGDDRLQLLAASIAAGAALHFLVERPFLLRRPAPGRATGFLAGAALALGGLAAVTQLDWPRIAGAWRADPEVAALALDPAAYHREYYGGAGFPLTGRIGASGAAPSFLFAGDSHALHFAGGLHRELRARGLAAETRFDHGCFFLPGPHMTIVSGTADPYCRDNIAAAAARARDTGLPLALGISWSGYRDRMATAEGAPLPFEDDAAYRAFLEAAILDWRRSLDPAQPMILIGEAPGAPDGRPVIACLTRSRFDSDACEASFSYDIARRAGGPISDELKALAARTPGLFYVDPADALCADGVCESYRNGLILYSDASHLSIDGSLRAAPALLAGLLSAIGPPPTTARTAPNR